LSKDITPILEGWDREPDEIQVRIVAGDDGRDKIQSRIDLGLIQMEMSGRPDGTRPGAYESLLELQEARARSAEAEGGDFVLDPRSCLDLWREGIQYYNRYLAAFHLQRFDLVVRDTERNLRLFAFVARHASRKRDRVEFDRYRPYVTMMRSKAQANLALAREDRAGALDAIDEGIERIRQFLREYEQDENETECIELVHLLRWRSEVESEHPVGPAERLEHQLDVAVALEKYEEAARLRDQLHRLRGTGVFSGPRSS
jgi:hypothetical protein